MPDEAGAPFFCSDPGPIRKRRIMTDVLRVSTAKLGDPILSFVLAISNNLLQHVSLFLRGDPDLLQRFGIRWQFNCSRRELIHLEYVRQHAGVLRTG
jgi:hypothetical protein